ncbi:MAG: glycosyltransferase family 4 protein [Bacteroidetes bacterium]|nr:glycosyltransferase family 4 protein [Bacteroidota bacterium]
MPRILFIAAHRPDRSPSQRFRFEQYFAFLQSQGYDCKLKYIISSNTDSIFYHPTSLLRKGLVFITCALRRLWHVIISGGYDVIFIQREAFMTGSIFFEKQFKKSGAKLIFDFDDAIWKHDVSESNRKFGWLKRPEKTGDIISLSELIIAGNNYLADYALQHNKNVIIIPTTIDTEKYTPSVNKSMDDSICIGWSGSATTIRHFANAIPALSILKQKYGNRIFFKVIGAANYRQPELELVGEPWKSETEVSELQKIDIGIMPLPDDEWSKGKCALKGLQYMALSIPTVMSPVGMNSEIITHGENGFLANTTEEWVHCLSLLIEDYDLRLQIGASARELVVQNYSVTAQQNRYLQAVQSVIY